MDAMKRCMRSLFEELDLQDRLTVRKDMTERSMNGTMCDENGNVQVQRGVSYMHVICTTAGPFEFRFHLLVDTCF